MIVLDRAVALNPGDYNHNLLEDNGQGTEVSCGKLLMPARNPELRRDSEDHRCGQFDDDNGGFLDLNDME